MTLHEYQREFIAFALHNGALRFGQFTLNSGLFNNGALLAKLGAFYADTIIASQIPFDMLYGPAYKGIPLATATAIALATHPNREVPVCFNRKETKDHGEGGNTLGAALEGRVLIIDDVISAGTSINESVRIIQQAGGQPCGVVIALNRQERGNGKQSAIQEVEGRHGIEVHSIATLDLLLEYLSQDAAMADQLAQIREYRAQYGEQTGEKE